MENLNFNGNKIKIKKDKKKRIPIVKIDSSDSIILKEMK